jgi:hypothetical protein
MCVWVEPDGSVFAAELDVDPAKGWRRLRTSAKLEGWSGAASNPPIMRIAKGVLFAVANESMALYGVSATPETFEIKKLETRPQPSLVAIDVDDPKVTLRWRPDKDNKSWTVNHSIITDAEGRLHLKDIYHRDFEKEILDFNVATTSVVMANQSRAGRVVLKRHTQTVRHQERQEPRDADLVRWLGAKDRMLYGVRSGFLDQVKVGQDKSEEAAPPIDLTRLVTDGLAQRLGTQIQTVTYGIDTAGEHAFVLVVVPEAAAEGKEENQDSAARAGSFVAVVDLKTRRLKGDLIQVQDREPQAPPLRPDFVLTGTYTQPQSDRRNTNDRLASTQLRVFLTREADGAFRAEHDPNVDRSGRQVRAGGKAGYLHRNENETLIRIEPGDDDKERLSNRRREIRISSGNGRIIDFGFIDQGENVFVAYEEGQVEVWNLDVNSKQAQPFTINTHTRLNSAQHLAWSGADQVLQVHDKTSIRWFNRLGYLLELYTPGRVLGAIMPLASGELFAVSGTGHIVLPAVDNRIDMHNMPYVAESATPRWLASSDDDVRPNWFLPSQKTGEDSARKAEATPATCRTADTNYTHECTRLNQYHVTPGQKLLATSEHAYRALEQLWPGRGRAFALVDAAAGKAVGSALIAREIANIRGALTSSLSAIPCNPERVEALRKLFAPAIQEELFVAPLYAAMELRCGNSSAPLAALSTS